MVVTEDLIYDVGMYDGSDTACYLHRGYRVVAIEANPQLVDAAQLRFADALDSGRLHLLNLAIHETPGLDLPFWISEMTTCSSFSEGVATKYASATATTVRTESFDRVLAAHGVPRYLKIDIETLTTPVSPRWTAATFRNMSQSKRSQMDRKQLWLNYPGSVTANSRY